MRIGTRVALLLLLLSFSSPGQGEKKPTNDSTRATAESGEVERASAAKADRLYEEGSYQLALEQYKKLSERPGLEAGELRRLAFRIADATWRAEVASRRSDWSQTAKAEKRLQELAKEPERPEERDQLWAEIQESLGDLWATREAQKARPHYDAALDWWAGARASADAADRYLRIIWKVADPKSLRYTSISYGGSAARLSLDVAQSVLKLARSDLEKAHAHGLIAEALLRRGLYIDVPRVAEEFELALLQGHADPWFPDTLMLYAGWLSAGGRLAEGKDGRQQIEPDFVRSAEQYRRLLATFKKSETPRVDEAQRLLDEITKPVTNVTVANTFLPDSEMELRLETRNVSRVDFTVHELHLDDLQLEGRKQEGRGWFDNLDTALLPIVRTWSRATGDTGEHRTKYEGIRLEPRLPIGAYLVTATSTAGTSRELILVTDIALVIKHAPKKTFVWVVGVIDGAPLAGVKVQFWSPSKKGTPPVPTWRGRVAETNADGMAVMEWSEPAEWVTATAAKGIRQAYGASGSWGQAAGPETWRVFAFADRPAYRPRDTVMWKVIARVTDGSALTTPAGRSIGYTIFGPQGAKVSSGTMSLNAFGSAWSSFELPAGLALGEYKVGFSADDKRPAYSGYEAPVLFRLEEYKLPEFRVGVETPIADGRRKVFRSGDKVEVVVRATRYSGGPVVGANVELHVYQRGFLFRWDEPEMLSWYGDRWWSGAKPAGELLQRLTARTGADGSATLAFETKRDSYSDLEYRLEARVVDSSRREVVAEGTVRVSRQLFASRLKADKNICRPGESVTLRVETRDANQQPVPGAGVLTVTRQTWNEVWTSPDGKEWSGEELRQLQETLPYYGFNNIPGWKNVSREYRTETLVSGRVVTSAEGFLELPFAPDREGYYKVSFSPPPDGGGSTSPSETAIWATRNETLSLGNQPMNGLELITDRASYRPGDTAQVLVVARSGNRWLLFTTEADAVESWRSVRMNGDVALLDVPIVERLTPNAFLTATSIREGKVSTASKEILVPPLQHFLDLSIRPAREEVRPGDEVTLELTAKDYLGRPVVAELGLGVVDESVSYIQKDPSGDPRPFFHGTKRTMRVQTQASMQQKPYMRFVVGSDGKLEDAAVAALRTRVTQTAAPPRVWPQTGQDVRAYDSRNTAVVARAEMSAQSASYSSVATPLGGAFAGGTPALDTSQMKSVARDAAREPAVEVRTDFRTTAFWQPDVVTDVQGNAAVSVRVPDSLTSWKAIARGATTEDQYGLVSSTFRANLALMVRLEAPRFLVSGDTSTLSGVIDNGTDEPVTVHPTLEAPGLSVEETAPEMVTVPAHGEMRADWVVRARATGEVRVRVVARADAGRDAMERTLPVYEHGLEKLISTAEKLTHGETTLALTLPAARRAAALTVQVEPSLAGTMIGALPYLLDYPYGCVEQTMSRFLPAAIVRRTLTDLGLSPRAVSTALLAHAAAVDENGAPRSRRGPEDLDRIVRAGLARLDDMQHSDGGWGWWKGDQSDPYMTAYVVWGLSLARDAGISVKDEILSKGSSFIASALAKVDLCPEMETWLLHALSSAPGKVRASVAPQASKSFERLWNKRSQLNSYSVALLALSAHQLGNNAAADVLARNLRNGVRRDRTDVSTIAPGASSGSSGSATATAHWGEDRGWRTGEGSVEATAFALRALAAIEPDSDLIEPAASWLARNRRAGRWTNTRDTAIAVLALDEVLRAQRRATPDISYELIVNGMPIGTQRLSGPEALLADGLVEVDPALVRDGRNEVRVRRTGGSGPLWVSASARFFSLEEPVHAAGSALFVKRQYFRMKPVPTLLKGTLFDREELADGDVVTSGERIETIITLEAKNDYEYLLVEDLKPAGFEAVQVRSGEALVAHELNAEGVERKHGSAAKRPVAKDPSKTTRADTMPQTQSIHQELRDRKIALFFSRLREGVWEVRYDLRAETPGQFHALPVTAHAMYAPDLRGNGEEIRVKVLDRPK